MMLARHFEVSRFIGVFFLTLAMLLPTRPSCAVPVEMVGQWGGKCKAIAVSGNRIYVGKGQKLLVFDSSSRIPAAIGESSYLRGVVESIALMGNYAYLACSRGETGGLQQVSVADPSPISTGYIETACPGLDVCTANNLVYAAFGGTSLARFVVFRVSDNNMLSMAGYRSTFNDPTLSIAAVGNRIYVTNEIQSVGVYSIPDLQAQSITITKLGRYESSFRYPSDILVDGSNAYIADGIDGVRTVDVSTTSNIPAPRSVYPTNGDAQALVKVGNRIYVANGDSGIQLLDATNPTALSKLGECTPGGFTQGLALSGNTVYAAGTTPGLSVVDFTEPTSPTKTAGLLECGEARDISVKNHYALAAGGKAGLEVIDIADPCNMTRTSSFNTDGYANGLCLAGNYAYVADSSEGLKVFDVSVPTNPVQVAACSIDGPAKDVAVSGNLAFVSYEDWEYRNGNYEYLRGFTLVDITDPNKPERITNYPLYYRIKCLAASGNNLYVGVEDAGLYVFDVSIPSNPIRKTICNMSSGVFDITIIGDLAYLAAGTSGLQILSITNPSSPTLIGSYQPGSFDARAVCIDGNTAYVANAEYYSERLQAVDITNPRQPLAGESAISLQTPSGIAVSGSYIFVANESAGLTAFHIGTYPPPMVNAITPKAGFGTEVIHTVNLLGSGFRSGASVRLTKLAQNDIQAVNMQVLGPTQITCDFDLTAKAPGLWDVVVTNPDGLDCSLDKGFGIMLPDTNRVYGANNRAAYASIIDHASKKWCFRFWGKVTNIDLDSFWLDDGSKKPIKIIAPGHIALSNNDYATAAGTLDYTASPLVLLCSADGVRRLEPETKP